MIKRHAKKEAKAAEAEESFKPLFKSGMSETPFYLDFTTFMHGLNLRSLSRLVWTEEGNKGNDKLISNSGVIRSYLVNKVKAIALQKGF